MEKTEGNVITQTFYSYGQGKAIKQATRVFYNAWSGWQYHADWDNVITGIAKHNEGINITKGDATELIKLITNNKSDSNTLLAPTLSVVKSLIGDVNIDVPSILKSKGVRYDFSNENAWYICFGEAFGGLIIQGGKANIEVSSRIFDNFINFPVTFTRTPIVTATNTAETLDRDEWATSAISVISLMKFKYQTAQNGVSKLQWIAIGK